LKSLPAATVTSLYIFYGFTPKLNKEEKIEKIVEKMQPHSGADPRVALLKQKLDKSNSRDEAQHHSSTRTTSTLLILQTKLFI
jgi:hypothetical protein